MKALIESHELSLWFYILLLKLKVQVNDSRRISQTILKVLLSEMIGWINLRLGLSRLENLRCNPGNAWYSWAGLFAEDWDLSKVNRVALKFTTLLKANVDFTATEAISTNPLYYHPTF